MSKKERKKRRSVASATAKRRETAGQASSDLFHLPEGAELMGSFPKSSGVVRMDVIPYTVGEGNPNAAKDAYYWERTFFIHRGVGVNDAWVVCPARTVKKKCPICEFVAKMQNDPEADEDAIKALLPSKRMILNIRDLTDAEGKKKVKVWHVPHAYFGKAIDDALAAAYEDHKDNMDNFCDPDGGHYLKCVAETGWQGKGYSIERVDFKPRKKDLDDDILDQVVCLDDILVVKKYDELKSMLLAGGDEEDEPEEEVEEEEWEDEEEEVAPPPKTKKKKKKKPAPKPEPEEEEWEEEEIEEEEEEVEEEEEEEVEEEEEEPEPVKKKKKKKKKKKPAPKVEEEEEWEEDWEE